MSGQELGHRQANRRTALNLASRYLDHAGVTFADYAGWAEEVTDLADRLLPWLNVDLDRRARSHESCVSEGRP